MRRPSLDGILKECRYSTARSGGPGGQHVNKVNSKVILKWHVASSEAVQDEQRAVIQQKLAKYLNTEGDLVLSADGSRHQMQNKEAVKVKLDNLIERAFRVKKARKATKPTRSSVLKRLEQKAKLSEKKKRRRNL